MTFAPDEIEYLSTHGLGRLATVAPDGQPDVVPLAVEFDGADLWVGGQGESVLATRKMRNIASGRREVAIVIDDVVSFDPFVARGVRIYGRASDPVERVGMVGPGIYVRITPTVSWSWNLEGAPVGDEWYPTRRTVHASPADADPAPA